MIYDQIYAMDRYYNAKSPSKIKIVLDWVNKNDSILDVGCGRGHYLKELCKRGLRVTGLEPSQYICNKLSSYPVINKGIMEVEGSWDALYCMDVLEHIEPQEIDKVVAKLASLAPKALIGVANHSDKWRGTQLHLIREEADWWGSLLKKHYPKVKPLHELKNYYVFSCSR